MPDLAVVPASVLPSHKSFQRATAGVAIAAGDLVYRDTNGVMQLSDADSGTPAAKAVDGIAVNSAAAGQPVDYVTEDGGLALGVAVTEGDPLFLSATAGKIADAAADLIAGMKTIFIGVGLANNKVNFKPVAGGTNA
jgi:hypothetical protein